MKKWKVLFIGMIGTAAISLTAAGFSLCFPAFAQTGDFCAPQRQLASHGETATDSQAGRGEEGGDLADDEGGGLADEDGSLTDEDGSLADEKDSLPEADGSLAQADGSLTDENGSLAEENGSLAQENGSLAQENGSLAQENGGLAETNGNLTEENGSLVELDNSLAESDPQEGGDLLETEEMIKEATPDPDISKENSPKYTVCEYVIWYRGGPPVWELGKVFDADSELPKTVDVYLDGPEGPIDDCPTVPVQWDTSQVDISAEGSYTVTGVLDTESCEYPVDWDNAPPLSFTVEIARIRTMSFRSETNGDELILNYEMDNAPFRLPVPALKLYESTDQGHNWFNISQSRRVRATSDNLVITGITADSLYQAMGLQLGHLDSSCSDIVQVSTADGALTASIIPSGGIRGGEQWNSDNGSKWNLDCIPDGPYPILEYNSLAHRPLEQKILVSHPDSLARNFFGQIRVYYGDAPQGFWEKYVVLDVNWDWAKAAAIDWNRTGDTVISGTFAPKDVEANKDLLDFSTMPELRLTISVYSEHDPYPFLLEGTENKLFENNTVKMKFYKEGDAPLTFDTASGMTVWCSDDGGETWYKITDFPNVSLTGGTLTVSHLKNQVLRGMGYAFQVEQTGFSEYEQYSSALSVSYGIGGLQFGPATGGERGGGKRQEKPPEGFFDDMGQDNTPEEPTPPSEPAEPEKPPETAAPPSIEPVRPPSGNSDGNGDSGGNSVSGGNHSSGKHNPASKVPIAVEAAIIPVSPAPEAAPKAPLSGSVYKTEDSSGSESKDRPSGSHRAAAPEPALSGGKEASGSQNLSDGQNPSGGQNPSDGQNPSGGQNPSDCQTPSGGQNLSDGQNPALEAGPDAAAADGSGAAAAALPSDARLRKDLLRRRLVRFTAGITAVLIGGAAGFLMIRRR